MKCLVTLVLVTACGFHGHGDPEEKLDASLVDGTPLDADVNSGIPATGCAALTPAVGARTVTTVDDLRDAILHSPPHGVISLDDGTYDLAGMTLVIATEGLVLRSTSGDPSTVIVIGGSSIAFSVQASDVALAAFTIEAQDIGVRASGGTAGTHGLRLHAMHFLDNKTALVINSGSTAAGGVYADAGTLSCSTIEASDETVACVDAVHGIRAFATRDWIIRDNRFANFSCSTGFDRTIEIDRGSRDFQIIGNTFVNNTSNMLLGATVNVGDQIRGYADPSSCTGEPEYRGGVVCNNVITGLDVHDFGPGEAFQEGVAAWTACDVTVAQNTIVSPPANETFSVIEYRYASTRITLVNNLIPRAPKPREMAMAVETGDVIYTDPDTMFVDPRTDLHLVDSPPIDPTGVAIDAVPLQCRVDRDGVPRAATPTAGAYER